MRNTGVSDQIYLWNNFLISYLLKIPFYIKIDMNIHNCILNKATKGLNLDNYIIVFNRLLYFSTFNQFQLVLFSKPGVIN